MKLTSLDHPLGVNRPETDAQKPVFTTRPGIRFGASPVSDRFSVRFSGLDNVAIGKAFIDSVKKHGILISGGAGTMGNDIAMNAMNFGIPVYAQDMTSKKDLIVSKMRESYAKAVKKGAMSQEKADQAMANLRGTLGTLKDEAAQTPKDVAMVIEAIPEVLNWKTDLFRNLDEHLGPDTILATNTSSLSVAEIAKATRRPDRVIGLHYFLPANRNRFIEVIPGPQTSEETLQKTLAFVRAVGKTPIVCKDSPGFVVNRIGVPLINEGVRLYDKLKNGDPDHDRLIASYIDQVALETMWPNAHKKPGAFEYLKKNALLPMGTLNRPEYMGLIGEIVEILDKGLKHRYGSSYASAPTILTKMAQFKAVSQEVNAEGKPQGWSEEKIRAELAARLVPHHIPIATERLDIPPELYKMIQERLLGAVFGVSTQLLDEQVTRIADIDRGVKTGLQWEVGPIELLNQVGPRKALKIVQDYSGLRPGFKVADTLRAQAARGSAFDLSFIDSRKEGSVQYLTINKPQRHNAMDGPLLNDLLAKFKAAEGDPEVKTIVIESIGGKNFAAGADLPWLMQEVEDLKGDWKVRNLPDKVQQGILYYGKIKPFLDLGFNVMDEIARSPKVTVAKVNGNALGGGTELALACDYIVAAESANMGLPEVKYGIFPAWGGTERLPQRVGKGLAKWMILNGGFMGKGGKGPAILNGKDAHAIGLADKVASDIELDSVVKDAIDSGEFSKKPARSGLRKDLCGSRFEDAHWRYTSAPLGELIDSDLKGYYDKITDVELRGKMKKAFERVLGLANRRVDQGLKKHPGKDLQQMMINMQSVDSLERKAKKAAQAAQAQPAQ